MTDTVEQQLATAIRQRDTAIAILVHVDTNVINKDLSISLACLLKELGLEKEFRGAPVKKWK